MDLKQLNKMYDEIINPQKENKDIITNKYCDNCSNDIELFRGTYLCKLCGIHYGCIISSAPEWKEFNDDATVKGVVRCSNSEYLWNSKVWMSSTERSLMLVHNKLKMYGVNGGLTKNIIDLAKDIYTELYDKQTNNINYTQSRGDFRDGLIATCLLYACNENNVSRSINELSRICCIEESDITRAKKLFVEIMKDTKLINLNKISVSYKDYILRYCNILDISEEYMKELYKLTEIVDTKKIIPSNTPKSMVCGCIFYLSIMYNLNITKNSIAKNFKISIPTINKVYNTLLLHTSELI